MSAGAVLGSLYFSQIKGLIPCELCWFQRIFIYPVPIILIMAGYRKDKKGYLYALPLVIICLLIALYHVSIQTDPNLATTCGGGESCTDEPAFWFSWLSIPLASALMSTGMAGLLGLLALSDRSATITGKTSKKSKK